MDCQLKKVPLESETPMFGLLVIFGWQCQQLNNRLVGEEEANQLLQATNSRGSQWKGNRPSNIRHQKST
uniref:Uncharacterized protein n=1 Tax=Globodera rostochiensis TaxID=31243 RepID=A0A914H2N0_GLORO